LAVFRLGVCCFGSVHRERLRCLMGAHRGAAVLWCRVWEAVWQPGRQLRSPPRRPGSRRRSSREGRLFRQERRQGRGH
jgi:hypothetical protein